MGTFKSLHRLVKVLLTGSSAVGAYCSFKFSSDVGIGWDQTIHENVSSFKKWLWHKSEAVRLYTLDSIVRCCEVISKQPWFTKLHLPSALICVANSSHPTLHGLGTRLLSSISLPDEVDMPSLIDQCKWYTLVGLARFPETDARWFPPPVSDTRAKQYMNQLDFQEVVEHFLHLLVTAIPKRTDSCHIWLYQSIIGEKYPKDPEFFLLHDFTDDEVFSDESMKSSSSKVPLYLDILRRFSRSDNAGIVVTSEFLKLLKTVLILCQNDHRVLEVSGSILANLSASKNLREIVVSEGLLPVVYSWKHSKDIVMTSIADRILFNLDTLSGESQLLDGVYLLHPTDSQTDEDALVDVVFVHGIWGSPFYTWRQNECVRNSSRKVNSYTYCWPQSWLAEDIPQTRIISLQYDSYLSSWSVNCPYDNEEHSLKQLAYLLAIKLRKAGVGKKPIVWVTHSMGGLLVKQLLAQALADLKSDQDDAESLGPLLLATKSIVFYAVPHFGSPIATKCNYARFPLYPSMQAFELVEGSDLLKSLHMSFQSVLDMYNIECLNFRERHGTKLPYLNVKTLIVPETSCEAGYGRMIDCDTDHLHICKPTCKTDPSYSETYGIIKKVLGERCEEMGFVNAHN